MKAPLHPDEKRRLAALATYEILDTPHEAAFDEIAALAASICEVPVSIVNLVAEGRQFFKAAVGVTVDTPPLEVALCAHAILNDNYLEVANTTLDSRFQDNPLVTGGPQIRFYAGAVLETPEKLPLGTLCVLDVKPRVLTELQKQTLKVLGHQVMVQLELRKRLRQLEEERLRSDSMRAELAVMNQELERRIEERTRDLQASVREAESFNYSISHDLRAPLRAINASASILLEELSSSLAPGHTELLERQAFNAKRLGLLVDDLLKLSRLSRASVNRENFDLSYISHEIVREFGPQIIGERKILIDNDLPVHADRQLVRTLLTNLLENAIKFSGPASQIQIGVDKTGRFLVRDQGIGLDMAYRDKIFLPFERLVREDEFPGTGIGLANVKRIVERHEGRIWVESEVGRGATFFFTLNPSIRQSESLGGA